MNLMTVFFLQAAPAAAPNGSMMWIMLIAMFVIMYFFMIRPQNKKQKEIANFRKSLQVNQKVITAGGIHGVIKEINDKYPGQENALKRNQKMMELYSRAGANPMSGCLPMLLQMPILIAMFSFFPSAIELRGESFLWAKDLSAPDVIFSWDAHIPLISTFFGNHLSLFCLLMTAVNILYTYINMQSNPSSNQMPGMKWMMYLMPVMFLVFFNNYAAGLSYYYFLSLIITIGQTYAFRLIIKEDKVRAKMAENAKKPKKKSGFMARLEEAQRQQQAMLREQQKRKGGK